MSSCWTNQTGREISRFEIRPIVRSSISSVFAKAVMMSTSAIATLRIPPYGHPERR
ncbi:MAG: hypothetical protein IRY85_05515 [Micromonosporaceae bacterium]|nr:hypothetical protein [Micromonosporaceae bacterium]